MPTSSPACSVRELAPTGTGLPARAGLSFFSPPPSPSFPLQVPTSGLPRQAYYCPETFNPAFFTLGWPPRAFPPSHPRRSRGVASFQPLLWCRWDPGIETPGPPHHQAGLQERVASARGGPRAHTVWSSSADALDSV